MSSKKYHGYDIKPELLIGDSPFRNTFLVAMPSLRDGLFAKSVVYVCAHSDAGAMGIVINQKAPDVRFGDLLEQLSLPKSKLVVDPVIYFGGPVETGRGFVLHSDDVVQDESVRLDNHLCITGTIDILKSLADGSGPRQSIFALGYAGWDAGQLEREIHDNSWLTVPADKELLFDSDLTGKWERALSKLGVTPAALTAEAGHA